MEPTLSTPIRFQTTTGEAVSDLFGNVPVVDNGFDQFWRTYPKRVGKADAEKAWKKISPNPQLVERMIAAIDWQIYVWDKHFQFTPYPATWLRGRRWEDEIPGDTLDWLQRLASGANPEWARTAQDILTRNGIVPRQRIVPPPPSQTFIEIQKRVRSEYGDYAE